LRAPTQLVDGAAPWGDGAPVSSLRPLASTSGALVLALVSLEAHAQAPAGVPGSENFAPSLRTADEGEPKPYAEDERSGHLLLRGTAALAAPAGSVAEGVGFGDAGATGGAFGGGIGIGLSRYVELDASASVLLLGEPDRCVGCSLTGFSASLGLSYHLAQGVAIDPWVRFGAGFRSIDVDTDASTRVGRAPSGTYLGVDVAQLALGASFAPVGGVAFGPFIGLDLGTFLERPSQRTESGGELALGGSTYAVFQAGLRFELDPVRWFGGAAPPSPGTAVREARPRPAPAPPEAPVTGAHFVALPSVPEPL
jgi:hypothetical protein